MSSTRLDPLKLISIKQLIHGWIRQQQNDLFADKAIINPFYNIPPLVINCCILFYQTMILYIEQYGQDLDFLSSTEVRLSRRKSSKWSTCVFQEEISNQFCNECSITFKIKSYGDNMNYFDFHIGYITGDSINGSISNWNEALGQRHTKSYL